LAAAFFAGAFLAAALAARFFSPAFSFSSFSLSLANCFSRAATGLLTFLADFFLGLAISIYPEQVVGGEIPTGPPALLQSQ
jgi:hypothetical protein